MYKLEEETEADWWEVEALYDLCFAPGRTALSSYRLRDGVPTVAALSSTLVAVVVAGPRMAEASASTAGPNARAVRSADNKRANQARSRRKL